MLTRPEKKPWLRTYQDPDYGVDLNRKYKDVVWAKQASYSSFTAIERFPDLGDYVFNFQWDFQSSVQDLSIVKVIFRQHFNSVIHCSFLIRTDRHKKHRIPFEMVLILTNDMMIWFKLLKLKTKRFSKVNWSTFLIILKLLIQSLNEDWINQCFVSDLNDGLSLPMKRWLLDCVFGHFVLEKGVDTGSGLADSSYSWLS